MVKLSYLDPYLAQRAERAAETLGAGRHRWGRDGCDLDVAGPVTFPP